MTTYAPAHGPPDQDEPFPDPDQPPQDVGAERSVLGSLILAPHLADTLTAEINGADFYNPHHETIWDAAHYLIDEGTPLDTVTLVAHLTKTGQITKVGGPLYLHDLTADVPTPANGPHYAAIVRELATLRALDVTATQLRHIARHPTSRSNVPMALANGLQLIEDANLRFGPASRQPISVPNIAEFLTNSGADTYDWIIPGLLERHDRIILTGGEGSGKSTLGRQIAVQATAGIHPFTGAPMDPIRVLILDFENTEAQLKRDLAKLYGKASRHLTVDRLRIQSRIQGINLLDPDDRTWVNQVVTDANPDLIITGPAYKMTDGDTDKEKESKPVALYLDQIRSEHHTAVWLEAHVGNEQAGTKKRPERPFGWSGWRRWPEFGLYLSKEGELVHWRGARDQRDWPHALSRTGTWPWNVAETPDADQFEAIKECVMNAGQMLSNRAIARLTKITEPTVRRVIGRHGQEWEGVRYHLEETEQT